MLKFWPRSYLVLIGFDSDLTIGRSNLDHSVHKSVQQNACCAVEWPVAGYDSCIVERQTTFISSTCCSCQRNLVPSCPRSVQVLTWIWITSTCRMWITWAAGLPAAAGQSPWRLVCNLARCLGRTKTRSIPKAKVKWQIVSK